MTMYNNPEKYGLELVKDVDAVDCYEFDIVAIWRELSTGRYLVGHDHGCSCPSPFEDQGVPDLVPVLSKAAVAEFAREHGFGEEHVAALMDGLKLSRRQP